MANTKCLKLVKASTQCAYVLNDLGVDGGACSISFWFKPASTPTEAFVIVWSGAGSHVQYIFKYSDAGSGNDVLTFSRLRTSVAWDSITYTLSRLSTSTWYHVVLTYDGTNTRIYLNGSLVAGPTSFSGNGSAANIDYLSIGSDGGQGGSFVADNGRAFDGKIDDVILFSADIGATRASDLYSDPCDPDLTNAVARYKMEDNVEDSVGANDLTALNTPTYEADPAYSCAPPFAKAGAMFAVL